MTNASQPDPNFWKLKLAAYLHDPPSKCVDIRTHGDRSDAAFRQAGFTDREVGEYFRLADHTGAAADRLPFPKSQPAGLSCVFDGIRNGFLHPLFGQKLPFGSEFKSQELVLDGEGSVQPVLSEDSLAALADDDERWRARFFAHWRLWPKHAAERDYRMALLPADTRIPDHSIWTHMGVVSALGGCAVGAELKPAFLKFQLGPVQDFIAAARSIRDLWSGSYLLSWLMAAGMKALSAQVGPDAVIFPNLRGQPLLDLHWKEDLWDRVRIGGTTVWEDSLKRDVQEVLTPNLPNVFLAVVPAARASELAEVIKEAIDEEWRRIAEAVWTECAQAGLTADEGEFTAAQRRERFDSQVRRFLSISWRTTPWPDSLEAAMQLAERFADGMPIVEARKRVQAVKDMAEKQMPKEHRDGRFYADEAKTILNNIGLGWSVILALNSWELDAVRQTRAFDAANQGGWQVGTFSNKDVLTGREEAVAGGKVWWQKAQRSDFLKMRFKKPEWMGATTLIKRLWDAAYLRDVWGLPIQRMPNTRGIAAHDPFAKDLAEHDDSKMAGEVEDLDEPDPRKYFAILAFDGDGIGKWISGEKTPQFTTQLADYKDGSNAQRYGSKPYFEQPAFEGFLQRQRPLSPSYHLQFSEALGNFALLCARPIVEAFDGRLIFSGGDDVVALLPADTALECARALRMAFQGRTVVHPTNGTLFSSPASGFLHGDQKDDQGLPIPFLVPGPEADCSVGVAIAHFKAPLQDVVREAKRSEERAKRKLGRSAVAVTLMKRSGEIIEWGTKWDSGLELYRAMARALEDGQLSGKFPHRFAELLDAYVTDTTPLVARANTLRPVHGFPVDDIIRREFEHCLARHRGPRFPEAAAERSTLLSHLAENLADYLGSLAQPQAQPPNNATDSTEHRLRSLIGLCQTVAFAHRTGN